MSQVNHGTERSGLRRKLLAKLSMLGHARSLFSRASRSSSRDSSNVEPVGHVPEHFSNGPAESLCARNMSPIHELPSQMEEETPVERPEQVDVTEWYPHYAACLQHFLDCSQYSHPVQSMAAFINIRLPCQRLPDPIIRFSSPSENAVSFSVSLRHYIRRLIVTGHDTPSVLHAFFGDDWVAGVQCIWKEERISYLFTAKSSGWASTKTTYDILPDEHTPTLRPLRDPTEGELRSADARWSEWLAMEDWMVGPRSPW